MKKSLRTRQHIIQTTSKLFNKQGFAGTSLSDLSSATGLTKGGIYGNFKNKEEVALEVFRYNLSLLNDPIKVEVENTPNASQKLMCFINYYRNHYEEVFARGGCAILNAATDSDDGNLTLKKEVQKALNSWKQTLLNILNTGIEKNELKGLDVDKFSNMFIAIVEGSILLSKTLNQSQPLLTNLEFLENEILKITNN